jgi:uncharacterized protein
MNYLRLLKLTEIIEKKSVLLLGPRRTGKSTLLRFEFSQCPTWNLLESATYRKLTSDPGILRRELLSFKIKPKFAIIDEIQRIPELLNEIHLMIEEDDLKFILTGSSARSLRKKGINLLAGRARTKYFHPLVSSEIGRSFDLLKALNYGLIPSIYLSNTPQEDLEDYVGTYLKEEIAAEGLLRNLPSFSRFLEVAATCNGQLVNFTSLASDAAVKRSTVVDWFTVLNDTLLIHELPSFGKTTIRKAIQTSKFYFFDLGVARYLSGILPVGAKGKDFGNSFEHFIFLELQAAKSYGYIKTLHFWRSTSQFEVDFIVNESIAIEVKSYANVDLKDLKGMNALAEEKFLKRKILICTIENSQLMGDVEIFPWRKFLEMLWAGDFVWN